MSHPPPGRAESWYIRRGPELASLCLGILVLILTLASCGDDAQSVREANQAPVESTAEPPTPSAEIQAIELQEGDCIDSTIPEGISIDTVVIVPCSGDWQYRVVTVFDVPEGDSYPGEDTFIQQAGERCGPSTSSVLYPTTESWTFGDRTVQCLEEPPAETAMVPTSEPTAVPTNTPAPEPTAESTNTPLPEPTAAATNTPELEPTAVPAVVPTRTPTPEPTATPVSTPTPTPAQSVVSAEEVYARVSPSIPLIETSIGTGSGVLIDGGYVVTNYHVVWPYEAVWVVFPDGTELQGVPVVGWDPVADLAVLGPVDVSASALALVDGEDLAPGSELYLIGYPAEVELFPEPTITRGILSRFREWERLGMTYLQTDAAIAGGQSGGALVNASGEVVGISTYSFSEAGFGLATSAADDAVIVDRLIRGEGGLAGGDRHLPSGPGEFEFSVELANLWDSFAFVLEAAAGTILQAQIDGPGDGMLLVSDSYGLLLEVDEGLTGVEEAALELVIDGAHFLQVEMASGEASTFDLISTVRVRPFHDPDDGRLISVGETIAASIDHHSDLDWYSIELSEGETVRISTDSINVDTLLIVDFPGSHEDQVVSDYNSGGGLTGLNSEMVYRAPVSGEFFIAVRDATGDGNGGYFLSVEPAPAGSETVYVPPAPTGDQPLVVESPYGDMLVFEGPSGYFEIEVPAYWTEVEPDPSESLAYVSSAPDESGAVFMDVEEGVVLSLEEVVQEVETGLRQAGHDVARVAVETAQGLPAVLLEWSDGDVMFTQLIFRSDDGVAALITYLFPIDRFEAGREVAYYSFGTFQVN